MLKAKFKTCGKSLDRGLANGPWRGWVRMFLFAAVFLGGCASNATKPASSMPPIRQEEIDVHVRGFVDTFGTRIAGPYDRLAYYAKTPKERAWALQTRLAQCIAALTDATGPNPSENLLDIVVLVTLQRMSIEDHWIPTLLHEDGNDLLADYKQSEKEAWDLAARTFTDQQIAELKAMISKWKQENPTVYYTAGIKFSDFVDNAPTQSKRSQSIPSSLLGLLYIDPLAGLDPVTQEAHGFRMLSERLAFVVMRMPLLMNWQIADAANRVLISPEVQRIISASEQYAKVGDQFNETLAKYPSEYSQATKGAIDQINAAATLQRQAIFQELNAESGQVHDILADARNSIIVARDADASINASTTQTIAVAENASRRILHEALIGVAALIVIGFLWPAVVLFTYQYGKRRWLRQP